jgi:hypothetical protein
MSIRISRLAARLASSLAAIVLLAAATPRAAQETLPSAQAVVDRSIDAAGGASAFEAIKSIRARGTVSIPSQKMSGEFEMLAARPNKTLTRVTMAGIGSLEEGFDGKVGWSIDPVSGPAVMVGRALADRADEAWFDAPLHAPDFVKSVTMVGREAFDQRPAYRIKVVLVSGGEQEELFDAETGLQIGLEARRETPFGSAPTTTIHRDYQKHGAILLPTTQVERILGIEQVVTFTSYEFNTVPGHAFDLPAAVKALIK